MVAPLGGGSTKKELWKREERWRATQCCNSQYTFIDTVTMEVDGQDEAAAPLPTYTLDVLNIVRSAQAIHGLKHSEYSRYR